MTLDLRGGVQKKDAWLEFRFSNHCYSRGPNESELPIPGEMLVRDGARQRIFCQTRYSLSLGLVAHIDNLIAQNGKVEKSRHLNFFSTTIVTPAGIQTPYYVFMRPKKKQDPNQPPKLDIFVESAYHQDPNIPAPASSSGPIPLSVVLGEIWAPRR